jgi:PKD repeat protein
MEKKRSTLWGAFFIVSFIWIQGLLAAPSQKKVETVRVVVRFAKVHSLPTAGSRIVKEFGYGTMLHVLGQSGDYFQVAALNAPAAQPAKSWYVLCSEVEAVSAAAAQALVEDRRVTFMPEAPLAGQQVIFTASHFRKPSLLKWDMGDGTVVTSGGKATAGQDVSITYSYAASGKFLVKVFDEGGETGSPPVSVQVTVSARARSLRLKPESPMANQPVAITAVDFLTPERIAWDLGDGTEIKPGAGPGVVKASFLISHVYKKEGTYTVKAYDSGGDKSQPPVTVKLQVKATTAAAPPVVPTQAASEEPVAVSKPAAGRTKYNLIKIGPYTGYFQPQDAWFKQIYGKGDVLYGARLGVHIWNGFYFWPSASIYMLSPKTTYT